MTVIETPTIHVIERDSTRVDVIQVGIPGPQGTGGGGGGGGAGHTIQENGADLADETNLNFGNLLIASDDPGNNATKVDADLTALAEFVQDQVGAHVVSGDMTIVTYDDSTGNTTVAADVTALDERTRDVVGTALTNGANITVTVNDVGDTITIAITGQIPVANGGTGANTAGGARTNLGVGTAGTLAFDTDGTMAANSDIRIATQKAVRTALALKESLANKDVASGYAGLDGSGKLSASVIPAVALTETFAVVSQAAMLALTAQIGDVAVRSDVSKSFILGGTGDPTILGNWIELLTPTDAVLSVDYDGSPHTGAVVVPRNAAVGVASLRKLGTGSTDAAAGDDSRLSNARTPTAHASTHAAAGTDPISTNLAHITDAGTAAALASDTDTALAANTDSRVATQKATKAYVDAHTATGLPFVPTAVKVAGYTAAANDLVPCDTTSGGFTVTLPTAPADHTAIAVKHITRGGTNVVTVACGGSDAFNKAGGSTTLTLTLANQAVILEYTAGIWYVVSDDLSLAQLDLRYPVLDGSGKVLLANLPTALSTLRFGTVWSGGHSFTKLGGNATAGADMGDDYSNMMHRISSVLQAPSLTLWGKSGAQLSGPSDGSGTDVAGVGLWLSQLFPDQWYTAVGGTQSFPTRPTGKSNPALFVVCYGVNEPVRNVASAATFGVGAYTHALRTMIARMRAAMVYSSRTSGIVTFTTGFATTTTNPTSTNGVVTAPDQATGGDYRISKVNGDKVTMTVPTDFRGGTWYVTLMGTPNTTCYISTLLTSGTTTVVLKGSVFGDLGYKALLAGDVIVVDGESITLGATADGGITWTGCTRTVATSHAVNAVVTLPTTTAKVTWGTSTAPGASGHADTFISGVGNSADGVSGAPAVAIRSGIPVTVRFALTAADAGKTIVATVAGIVGLEYVGFDSCGIEDEDPNQVLLFNHPDMGSASGASAIWFTSSTATAYNAALTTVAAEFDANVAVVDIATVLQNKYRATVQTAIASTGTTTLKITPTSVSLGLIQVGSKIRVTGTAAPGVEKMLVTAIDKTNGGANDGTWALTVTRNIDAAGAQASITVGAILMDIVWVNEGDNLHPSDHGHNLYAAAALTTLTGLSRTTAQATNSGGVKLRTPRLRYDGYLPLVEGATRSANGPTLGVEYAYRFTIDEYALLVSLGFEVVVGSSGGGIAVASIRSDGPGRPGNLYKDLGTVTTGTTGDREVVPASLVPLRPGTYWALLVFQTSVTSLTVRGFTNANLFPPTPRLQRAAALTGSAADVAAAYSTTGITGALANTYPGGEVTAGTTPLAWLRLKAPPSD